MKGESAQKVGKMLTSFILYFTDSNRFHPGCFRKGLWDHVPGGDVCDEGLLLLVVFVFAFWWFDLDVSCSVFLLVYPS